MQNDFQVVNHEIEHDTDVGAPIWKRREPMRLDKARMRQTRLERAQDGIEALDVPDLQNELSLRGKGRELARLQGVFGDRFLDQEMLSFLQERLRDCEMRAGRRGDRGGVDQLRKFIERRGRANLVLLRNLRGGYGIDVVDGCEIGRPRLGIKARVIFADMPDPDHSDAKSFHGSLRLENSAN